MKERIFVGKLHLRAYRNDQHVRFKGFVFLYQDRLADGCSPHRPAAWLGTRKRSEPHYDVAIARTLMA